jgi:hypothetical protein
MSNNDSRILKDRLDALSRKLDEAIRQFKERGEFSDVHEPFAEALRGRQASIRAKLEAAIENNTTWDIIKYEFYRDIDSLTDDLIRWEKQLDAMTMKRGKAKHKLGSVQLS